jgi:hypothetical protein
MSMQYATMRARYHREGRRPLASALAAAAARESTSSLA